MNIPRSTYRLQFRNGMDFATARRLVPYLEKLGISHLYASPVATAVSGSTHGYDITRPNEIDPVLGGLEGLRALADDLHARGLGLILDIVPNHMASSLENPWWRSVVTWGEESPYAHYFDIDWSDRLTLPFLGSGFDAELEAGAITLALDPQHDAIALRYYDSFYPLHPKTYELILPEHERTALDSSPAADPEGAAILSKALAAPGARDALDQRLTEISQDRARIAAIHDAQPWRLADWRTASRQLSYRRFFEIAGLVGLRVEDRGVFEDSHRLVLDLVLDGTVDGLRIDHVDGLADPKAYLEDLRAAVGPDVYIVVEKILEKSELFAKDWPVQGTTGYEFIATLADALIDEQEKGRLAQAFAPLRDAARQGSYAEETIAAKRQILTENFEGEVTRAASRAKALADASDAELSRAALAEAIRAMIIPLTVYRPYLTGQGVSDADRDMLAEACRKAHEIASPDVREAIDFVFELLVDETIADTLPESAAFRVRFQQLSGAVMAKAMEDTLFYRENAFIALNEVGGDAHQPPGGPASFHKAMQKRVETMPHGLSTTATHDTKRGEDARARLYALSEAPDIWIAAVRRWTEMNAHLRQTHDERAVPEPDIEWLIYQALAGTWPIDGHRGAEELQALESRMKPYMEKVLREAKTRSSWTDPEADYEEKVTGFVAAILKNDAFLRDFEETLSPFIEAGLMNSLAQTLIKLAAPGVPDVYQGSERCDFSLVDPDNRRELDLSVLAVPDRPQARRETFPDYKQWLTATVLAERTRDGVNPFDGPYVPLSVSGDGRQAIAFLRGTPDAFAIAVVPRLTFRKTTSGGALRLGEDKLQGLSISLPDGFEGRTVRSALDGRTLTLSRDLPLADAFAEEPVALLISA
jgi:(1->4)-alpha-D-glucan 1-alpha-D-glucosylmutase